VSERILIDTDILIDVTRADQVALSRLATESQTANLAISVVTQMELIVGCRDRSELQILEKFLQRFEIVLLNENISTKAANLLRAYRLSHGLLIPDALIAATTLELQIPLLSKNQRDYRFIQNLNLLSYP